MIWASPRELLNIFQADEIGCHIITSTNDMIAKLKLVGKDLDEYSLETVQMFHRTRPPRRSPLISKVRRLNRGSSHAKVFNPSLSPAAPATVGSLLVPQLLEQGYKVTVYDTMFFGDDFLPKNDPIFELSRATSATPRSSPRRLPDMTPSSASLASRMTRASSSTRSLSTSINLDAFEPMVVAAKKAGVKRFIYASSSSVYGVSD